MPVSGPGLVELKHELSNPLMVIRWNLEVARELLGERGEEGASEDTVERVLSALDAALQGTDHASRLMRSWRGTRGSREPLKRLDLRELADRTLRMTRGWLEGRARVEVELGPEGEVLVEGSETRLRQVLLNLLDNAFHALPEGDPQKHLIRLSVRQQGGEAQVEVSDTGSGIAPELVPQLGEPYVSTRPGGTGLGLHLCSEIAWEHGGRLELESELNNGTLVRLCLPLPASIAPPPDTTKERELPTVKPPKARNSEP